MIDRFIHTDTCQWIATCAWDSLLALTPEENWRAMRGGDTQGLISPHWITVALIVILTVMFAMLIKISLNRLGEEKRRGEQSYVKNVRRHNLSMREYQLLTAIVKESGLRHSDAIFRQEAAFERGADRLLSKRPADAGPHWEQTLHAEIGFLRDKLRLTGMDLGLVEAEAETPVAAGGKRKRHRLSSRDLPEGEQLQITRRMDKPDDDFHGIIHENTNEHLVIQIDVPVKISFGEVWRARYYFGATVWEFETTVVSYDGNHLVLRHSNEVRFVNRRRFARVPTEHRAFIAHYPFLHQENASPDPWAPVAFVPATVTELAGPGLRVETALKVPLGDRVLITFRVTTPNETDPPRTNSVVQTIGEVRRVEPLFDRFALNLEVIGLKDNDIDHLVRLTNQAARTVDQAQKTTPGQEHPEQAEQDAVLEAVIDQGGA